MNQPHQPVEPPVLPSMLADTNGFPSVNPPNGAADLPQRIGDFTIVRILGEGGMGTVYLAEDVRLGRQAAIKTMKRELAAKPENRVRFVREAKAAAAVEHDNIVPVWQVGEAADGSPFIAMPFLQGEMLETRLKREPLQPLGLIIKVAREVAEGLAAAHGRGLIHRDIKPANLWLEGEPQHRHLAQQVRRCKILDFGLARSLGTEDGHITASGTILGTPAYMAPEQARGEAVDPRADLFSLGVLLYQMSTGRLPFRGPNMLAVLNALATVIPPPARNHNADLPQSLSDLIDRLMSRDPAGRPPSATAVVTALQQIVNESQTQKVAPLAAPVAPVRTTDPWEDLTLMEAGPPPLPAAKARRGRTPLLVALGLALLPLVWWLATVVLRVETANGTLIVEIDDADVEARIKNGKLILTGPDDKVRYTLSILKGDNRIDAGEYKIRVEGADGLALNTPKFELKKGDKVTVRVTVAPPVVAKNLDPDRTAAEWVLSIGGQVKVNGQEQSIKVAADLPREAFRLTAVWLPENKQVRDADLARFKDCKNLMSLHLIQIHQVSDAGLAHFKDCKNLTDLLIQGPMPGVSDTGLAHFRDLHFP